MQKRVFLSVMVLSVIASFAVACVGFFVFGALFPSPDWRSVCGGGCEGAEIAHLNNAWDAYRHALTPLLLVMCAAGLALAIPGRMLLRAVGVSLVAWIGLFWSTLDRGSLHLFFSYGTPPRSLAASVGFALFWIAVAAAAAAFAHSQSRRLDSAAKA